jgi:cell division septation protein DedD
MIPIRKFVGCIKVAAGIAFLLMAMSSQAASARETSGWLADSPAAGHETHTTLAVSAGCTAAIQAIKTAFADDRSEDVAERAQAALEPDSARDAAGDAAEIANFKTLFAAARIACAASIASVTATHAVKPAAVGSQCTAAVQALKSAATALWAQHTRPTSAQLTQLRTLGAAARTACGWSGRR